MYSDDEIVNKLIIAKPHLTPVQSSFVPNFKTNRPIATYGTAQHPNIKSDREITNQLSD